MHCILIWHHWYVNFQSQVLFLVSFVFYFKVAKAIIQGLNFADGRTRVGVMSFSDEPQMRFPMTKYTDQLSALNAMAMSPEFGLVCLTIIICWMNQFQFTDNNFCELICSVTSPILSFCCSHWYQSFVYIQYYQFYIYCRLGRQRLWILLHKICSQRIKVIGMLSLTMPLSSRMATPTLTGRTLCPQQMPWEPLGLQCSLWV